MNKFFSLITLLLVSLSSVAQSNEEMFNHFFISALECKAKSDYNKAFEYFSFCQRLIPGDPCVCYELAHMLLGSKQNDDAVTLANLAVKNDTTNNVTYIECAISANYIARNYDEVEKLYNKLFKIKPYDYDSYFELYSIFDDAKMHQKALDVLDKVKTTEEEIKYEVDVRRQATYLRMLKYRKAKKVLNSMLKKDPENSRTLYCMSRYHYLMREFDKSLYYCKLSTEKPDGDAYLFTLSDLYRESSQDSLFSDTYVRAFSSSFVSSQVKMRNLVSEMLNEDSPIIAKPSWRPTFEKVLAVTKSLYPGDPDFCLVRLNFFDTWKQQERKANELEEFLITNGNPGSSNLWREYFSIFDSRKSYSELSKYAQRAYEEVPDESFFGYLAAEFLYRDKSYVQCIESLNSLVPQLNQSKSQQDKAMVQYCLHTLAQCYQSMDSLESCFAVYDQLLSSNPDDAMALNNYAYFMAEHDMKLDECERMSSKCITISPNNASYLDTYAYILYKRGRFQEALFIIERCLSINEGQSAEVLDHYGDILYENGKVADAIVNWKKALELEDSQTIKQKIENAQK